MSDHRTGNWLLGLYLPTSALLIGLLGNLMRLTVPATGRGGWFEVLWAYALRSPDHFSILRWVAPAIGWLLLLLMIIAARSRKPILTVAEIRIILLVLIVLMTFVAKLFTILIVGEPASDPGSSHTAMKDLMIQIFLFVDVDLILAYLATYLPIFKALKRRLV
ncbi:MAG: hypothetical protein NTZ26_13965 [Candidatus Aminicenantes bacterium]|nr:hypothetical protein [Candidatus Aminicenantes bacterium]